MQRLLPEKKLNQRTQVSYALERTTNKTVLEYLGKC